MPYRPTLSIDSIGRDNPKAVAISLRNMGHLLWALVNINKEYLAAYFDQFPPLYEAGIVYDRMDVPAGSACGDDDWADIVAVYTLRKGDCEDLACIRVAECHVRWGLTGVGPHVMLQRSPTGRARHLYHIMVRWPEGLKNYPSTVRRIDGMLLECPSEVLGMTAEAA